MLGELLTLEANGALAGVFATKLGETGPAQPGTERLTKYVEFLPDVSIEEQAKAVRMMLARKQVSGIHAYFAHRPAEVAQHAARMMGVPFGFSTHARDCRKVAPEVLGQRAKDAACVVACNTDVARDIRALGSEVHLLPHGVDLQRFTPRAASANGVLRLLAVGRLVEKKGFHFLIAALAGVKIPFTLTIAGDGPERERLRQLISLNNLEDRVVFCGSVTHSELPRIYAEADVVVVPSVPTRDFREPWGLVVNEAFNQGVPVIATDAVGAVAGGLVRHERTGLVVPAGNPDALAAALRRLHDEPALRARLGAAAREAVQAYTHDAWAAGVSAALAGVGASRC